MMLNIHDSTATMCEFSAHVSDWDAQLLPPGSFFSIQYEQWHVTPIAWIDDLTLVTKCLLFWLNFGHLKSYSVKIDYFFLYKTNVKNYYLLLSITHVCDSNYSRISTTTVFHHWTLANICKFLAFLFQGTITWVMLNTNILFRQPVKFCAVNLGHKTTFLTLVRDVLSVAGVTGRVRRVRGGEPKGPHQNS